MASAIFGARAVSPGEVAKTPPSSRYKVLLEEDKKIPWRIIFLNQKRYDELGKRWIPTSLLAETSPDFRPLRQPPGLIPFEIDYSYHRRVKHEGILTDAIPFIFFGAELDKSPIPALSKLQIADIWYIAFAHEAGSAHAMDPIPSGYLALLADTDIYEENRGHTVALVCVPVVEDLTK